MENFRKNRTITNITKFGQEVPKINVNFSDFKRQLSHYIVLEPCEFG